MSLPRINPCIIVALDEQERIVRVLYVSERAPWFKRLVWPFMWGYDRGRIVTLREGKP